MLRLVKEQPVEEEIPSKVSFSRPQISRTDQKIWAEAEKLPSHVK